MCRAPWRLEVNPMVNPFQSLSLLGLILSIHSSPSILERYELNEDSLFKPGKPQYTFSSPSSRRISRKKEASSSASSASPASTEKLGKKQDTSTSSNTTVLYNSTNSFVIYLTCQAPVTKAYCSVALTHLARAASRIESVIHLGVPVYLNATFKPFCDVPGCESAKVLGQASPSNWYVFSRNDSKTPSFVDTDYSYPSALVRQWIPKDPTVSSSYADIAAAFNSDFNWWFSSAEQQSADDLGMIQNGQFGPSNTDQNSTLKSFDFEQVATHEMIHGLGFVSGWYPWFGNELYLPSFPKYDNNGSLIGLSQPFAFDRSLSDAVNGFWMKDYASQVYSDFSQSLQKAKTLNQSEDLWMSYFNQTDGGRIASSLAAPGGPIVTPRGVWSWYPYLEGSLIQSRYAILYTPYPYDFGSSMSHLENDFYTGTSQYLMKPYASRDVGLDGYVPLNSLGPIAESTLGVLRAMGYSTLL